MPLFARAVFALLNWRVARGGLAPAETEEERGPSGAAHSRQAGVRGETFAYWYLRRHGYTVVARNYRVPNQHGEIDLIGWDGPVLAFVEVKTRTTETGGPPEQAVGAEKQRHLAAMARNYLARQQLGEVRYRFDLLALEAKAGAAPVVPLHKGAFGRNE